MGGGGVVQVNKLEQVSSDDHQMSVVGGEGYGPMSDVGGGVRAQVWGGVPYLSHDACDIPTPLSHCEQTGACENITFRQLCL